MQSYKPEELFDQDGTLRPELAELAPRAHRRMGDNPHANGGLLLRNLRLPDFRDFAVEVPAPGGVKGEATRVWAIFSPKSCDSTRTRVTSGSSVPMRLAPTAWTRYWRLLPALGTPHHPRG